MTERQNFLTLLLVLNFFYSWLLLYTVWCGMRYVSRAGAPSLLTLLHTIKVLTENLEHDSSIKLINCCGCFRVIFARRISARRWTYWKTLAMPLSLISEDAVADPSVSSTDLLYDTFTFSVPVTVHCYLAGIKSVRLATSVLSSCCFS